MTTLIAWLKTEGSKHLEALIIAGAIILVGRALLQEHDARLAAEAKIAAAQTTIDGLKAQQANVQKAATAQVVVLRQEAAAVQTPVQAVTALEKDPEVKAALPSLASVPDAPEAVQLNALDLFKGVNACEQNEVNLNACSQELTLEKQIDVQKDAEVKAAQKKPGFFARLGKTAKVLGCAAAGGALGSLAGAKGAAIGAASGAGVCQLF
jgi:hypothetical protein